MQLIELQDFSAPDLFYHLTDAQLRSKQEPEKGVFIAEGPKVVHSALDAGYAPLSLLMRRKFIDTLGADIIRRCGEVPIYTAPLQVLEQIVGFKLTRGLLCAMGRKPLPDAADLCSSASRIAVLENVVNPTNIGAIFSSAAALGMDAVQLPYG